MGFWWVWFSGAERRQKVSSPMISSWKKCYNPITRIYLDEIEIQDGSPYGTLLLFVF